MSILVSILYGATDEYHQLHVPGRSASVYDLAANALGGLSYSLYWHLKGRQGSESVG
jgi:VanZ family protein